MDVSTKFRVAICGAGIGGLTLALALAKFPDIVIDIYEAAAHFENIGAGLAIWGRGLAVLKKLGLEERIRAIATAPSGGSDETKFELRRSDRPEQYDEGGTIGYLTLSTILGLHRSQFISLLVDMLQEADHPKVHFGKRLTSFVQPEDGGISNPSGRESVTLHFSDATSATCDVLIGCDGIRSAVRRQLHQTGENPLGGSTNSTYNGIRFSGTVAYRALVTPEKLKEVDPDHNAFSVQRMYCGKEKHIVTYPVGGGRFLNFIGYSSDSKKKDGWARGPWVAEAEKEELLEQYEHFEPEVQALLKCIDKSSRWAMHDVEPLQSWSRGCVTLLGDAAHAMTPFIGAGGGQVFEDAYILSQLLGSPDATRDTLSQVLRAYEQMRRPRANGAILCSREVGRALEYLDEYEGSEDRGVAEALARLTGWLLEWSGDPDEDVWEAKRILQEFLKQDYKV